MSLHILRHKKWHVWNQENEDIFTRDENEFMAKVEAEEKSARMNDMEKRIQLMKERNGIKDTQQHPVADPGEATNHAQLELNGKAEVSYGENEDYKAEEFERKLKDIQSLKVPIWKLKPTERPAQPWYSEDLSIKRNQSGKRFTDDELERHERRDKQLKELEDPLRKLKKFQEDADKEDSIATQLQMANLKNPSELKSALKTRMLNQPSDIQAPEIKHTSHSHSRHHHHKHHHKHHSVVSSIEESELFQQKKAKELAMQRMREERIKRETEERKRSTDLLMKQMKRLYLV